MGKRQINATLYLESRISWKGKEFVVEETPEGYLFAYGKYRTKILATDMPEWYVYGYLYKQHGYISAKNVKHLLYVPNYTIDNHYLKYDSLFISYGEPIEPYEYSEGRHWYKGHGHVLYGSIIVDFVKAAGKHSGYGVKERNPQLFMAADNRQ